MSSSVWVVVEECGEYSDYRMALVTAFRSETTAHKRASYLNRLSRRLYAVVTNRGTREYNAIKHLYAGNVRDLYSNSKYLKYLKDVKDTNAKAMQILEEWGGGNLGSDYSVQELEIE